jgi:DNA integrity scanning protein DisA with diadenylate cyclase activity
MLTENAFLIKSAFRIASKIKADAVIIHADPLDDLHFEERIPKTINLILISRKRKLEPTEEEKDSLLSFARAGIALPKIHLTRVALIKVATTLALSQELVQPGAKIVFCVGRSDTGLMDLIHIVDTSKESEIVTGKEISKLAEAVKPELFQTVLNMVMELADKGREGKPLGTIFVVGDHEKVLQLSKQMIMNPFKGYEEEERNIMQPSLKETIREFAAMDGAFIIGDDGTVVTAGRYLGAAIDESELPRGLGSRHIAAAGITALTKAIAFVISESTGDVRIFRDGKILMHIEKGPTKS